MNSITHTSFRACPAQGLSQGRKEGTPQPFFLKARLRHSSLCMPPRQASVRAVQPPYRRHIFFARPETCQQTRNSAMSD